MARSMGMAAECWTPERATTFVPALKRAEFEGAVWCSTDGVVDIHALLTGYLAAARSAGARIRYGCRVHAIETRSGRVAGVRTGEGLVETENVINASGRGRSPSPRSPALFNAARPVPPHLYITGPIPWVGPQVAFVWDVTHEFYFRPDSGGLLLCPCDQEEMAPCDAQTDESVTELLFEKIRRHLPELSEVAIRKHWAGLRTLSADGRFIIGGDPKVAGFFWVAGLGGHGVTTSSAVGALASRRHSREEISRAFSARAFQQLKYFTPSTSVGSSRR
jgi:glycine/D-amino acid oxidase-like deaminating enzyme